MFWKRERERESSHRQTLIALLAFLAILLLCSATNGSILVSCEASASVFKYMRRDIWTLLVLLVPLLAPRWFSACYGVLLYTAAVTFTLANAVHFHLYGMQIGPYVLTVIKETYFSESVEFIQQYLDGATSLIIGGGIMVTLPLFVLFLRNGKRELRCSLCIAGLLLIAYGGSVVSNGFEKVARWDYPTDFLYSAYELEHEKALFNTQSALLNPQLPADITCNAPDDELVVVVIGESSDRNHYSLYGYPRKTTPLLEGLRSQLFVFTDVISPHAHTSASLYKVMTFSSHTEPHYRCTVADVFNKAGFSTILLSNQAYLGEYETTTSALFSNCTQKDYSNMGTTSFYQSSYHDGILLKKLDAVFARKGKTVVFVHLLGSHGKYDKRYPDAFARFKDAPPYGKPEQVATINHYDNSIAYTDFILTRIIEKLRTVTRPSAMIYFSDHGEAMYEDGHTVGHAEMAKSRFMFEIPFLVYLSPDYRRQRPAFAASLAGYASRPWQTDNLNYSLFTLAGITFKDFPSQKDVFSSEFTPRKRVLAQDDYDVLFPEPFVFRK